MIKNPPANGGDGRDMGSIPGWGRSPWRRAWQPTPIFCLEGLLDRGAWQAIVRRIAKRQTQLK